MKKVIFLSIYLAFMSLILIGCNSKEVGSSEKEVDTTDELENRKLSIDSDFIKISLTKPKGVNEMIFDDKETLKEFKNILSSATREEGMVDMADPEYYMDLIYVKKNQQSVYLWIGEKGQRSTFMKPEDTNTIYTVSEEMTNKLIELFE